MEHEDGRLGDQEGLSVYEKIRAKSARDALYGIMQFMMETHTEEEIIRILTSEILHIKYTVN